MNILSLSDIHGGADYTALQDDAAQKAGRELRAASAYCPRIVSVGDLAELAVCRSQKAIVDDLENLFLGLTDKEPLDVFDVVLGNHDHLLEYNSDEAVRFLLGKASDRIKHIQVHRDYLYEEIASLKVLWTHGHLCDNLFRGVSESDRAQQRIISLTAGISWTPGNVCDCGSLEELEERIGVWVDFCFGNPEQSEPRRTLYESLCRFQRGRSCPVAGDAESFGMVGTVSETCNTPNGDALKWLLRLIEKDYNLKVKENSSLKPIEKNPDLLILGHSHHGGKNNFDNIEVHNCGGWVTDDKFSIPCSQSVLLNEKGEAIDFVYRFPKGHIIDIATKGRKAFSLPEIKL